jgi:2-amino-4-hydroxy-6-hydroxymethyldihydropteridine diphosphokinase
MEENIYSWLRHKPVTRLTTIKVEKLRLRAYIGFKKWETEKLQDLVINFSFRYNAAKAIETDMEEDVLDYKAITKSIIHHIDRQSFHLLEKVADDVLEIIRQNPYVRDIKVRIEKPYALRFSDNVAVEADSDDRTNEAIISLGSNIDAEEHISQALEKLSTIGAIRNRSEFIYTDPQKITAQPKFLNGAVILDTHLYLEDLIATLKAIEDDMGRERSGPKNGPRKIDLDVVLFNRAITDDEVYEYSFLQDFLRELKPGIKFDFSKK